MKPNVTRPTLIIGVGFAEDVPLPLLTLIKEREEYKTKYEALRVEIGRRVEGTPFRRALHELIDELREDNGLLKEQAREMCAAKDARDNVKRISDTHTDAECRCNFCKLVKGGLL